MPRIGERVTRMLLSVSGRTRPTVCEWHAAPGGTFVLVRLDTGAVVTRTAAPDGPVQLDLFPLTAPADASVPGPTAKPWTPRGRWRKPTRDCRSPNTKDPGPRQSSGG